MKPEIIRKIDELGRLVIPKDLRKMYGFKTGDDVYFTCQDDGILLHTLEEYVDRFLEVFYNEPHKLQPILSHQ